MFVGKINLKSELKSQNRVKVLKYGDSNAIMNPGDLIFQFSTDNVTGGNGSISEISLYLRGKDMGLIADYVNTARDLYNLNAEWLHEPVTRYLIQS